MLKQILAVAPLLTLGMAGISIAQTVDQGEDVPMRPVIESP